MKCLRLRGALETARGRVVRAKGNGRHEWLGRWVTDGTLTTVLTFCIAFAAFAFPFTPTPVAALQLTIRSESTHDTPLFGHRSRQRVTKGR